MILKALYDYYHQNTDKLPPQGLEDVKISFIIVIAKDGNFLRLEDYRESQESRVKRSSDRTSNVAANFLYDEAKYVLNVSNSIIKDIRNKYTIDFIEKVDILAEMYPENETFKAISLFYQKSEYKKIANDSLFDIFKKSKSIISFRLHGELDIAAENIDVINYNEWEINEKWRTEPHQRCLVTGELSPLTRLSGRVKLPYGEPNARLISFMEGKGYDSYGKQQCYNAPISIEAESAINTALNYLIKNNQFSIGNRTFVFWVQEQSSFSKDIEYSIMDFFNIDSADSKFLTNSIYKAFKSIFSGKQGYEAKGEFYMLGLSNNRTRDVVLYWKETTILDFFQNIKFHINDMNIGIDNRRQYFYGICSIFSSLFVEKDNIKVTKNLNKEIAKYSSKFIEDISRSIFDHTPYPQIMLHTCISKIKSEQIKVNTKEKDKKTKLKSIYFAIIKAYLNRLNDNNKKLTITMDKENTNQGYLCGRLFATLEFINERSINQNSKNYQESSSDDATYKKVAISNYLNAAVTTPSFAFVKLLELSRYHLSSIKSEKTKIFCDKLKCEIIDKISSIGFPTRLDVNDQGRFMVGYYHQRYALYAPKKNNIDTQEVDVN